MLSKVILVAEDNPDDALILKTRFKRAAMLDRLHIVDDGQQVIDWLSGKDKFCGGGVVHILCMAGFALPVF
jgi:hypothetical protein